MSGYRYNINQRSRGSPGRFQGIESNATTYLCLAVSTHTSRGVSARPSLDGDRGPLVTVGGREHALPLVCCQKGLKSGRSIRLEMSNSFQQVT